MRFLEFNTFVSTGRFLTERDVMNAPAIKQWALQAAQRVQNPTARAWFQSQVYDHLINQTTDSSMVQRVRDLPPEAPEWLVQKMDMGSPVFTVTPSNAFNLEMQTVADWVNAWIEENPGARIPHTWAQAVRASDEWHKDLAKGATYGEEDPNDDGLSTLMEFPDGFKWVIVSSATCLKREGGRMGHCVGGYHQDVASGNTVILSLRSPRNTPHCTIEVNEPDQVWWNTMAKLSRLIAADKQRSVDNPNQPELDFGMTTQVPKTQHAGVINQIKGKQNKPPVPKYVPYVKALMDAYTFTMSSYGQSDLENVGYYFREGKILTLKEVAKPYRKYPSGNAWVFVEQTSEFISLKLVNKSWQQQVSIGAHPTRDNQLNSSFTINTDSPLQFRPEVLDLVSTWKGTINPGMAKSLSDFDIYMSYPTGGHLHSNEEMPETGYKFGTPDEVSDIKLVLSDIEPVITIYQLVNFINDRNYPAIDLMMFDDKNRFTGVAPVHTGKDGNKVLGTLSLKRDTYTRLPELMMAISKKIGIGIQNSDLLGIQPDGSVRDKASYGEEVMDSQNGDYVFFEASEEDEGYPTLWVFDQISENIPIACIEFLDSYRNLKKAKIRSAIYTTDSWSDGGILGYLLLCIQESGQYDVTMSESELSDYGWVEYEGSYYYSGGADNIRIEETTTETDSEGNDNVTGPNDILMYQIDEIAGGSEFESYGQTYAAILANGRYRYTDESYDEDENEVGTEYYWELSNGQQSEVGWLEFFGYDHQMVRKLQRGSD